MTADAVGHLPAEEGRRRAPVTTLLSAPRSMYSADEAEADALLSSSRSASMNRAWMAANRLKPSER